MARIEALVKAELLEWARTSARLSTEAAAKKAHVSEELLLEWETGTARPSVSQLRLLAEAYKRPVAIFYLPKPPKSFDALHDFRRMSAQKKGQTPALAYEIRRASERREIMIDLLSDLGEKPAKIELTASASDEPNTVAASLRKAVGVKLATQTLWPNEYTAFLKWREALEDAGVLVFQTTGVATSEARGFSVDAETLPVIAVNGRDSYAGRIFTLIHELTHLALRQSGLCDLDEHGIEVFCNAVAGALLVPQTALLKHPAVEEHESTAWPDATLTTLAKHFGVSREVVLRRLLDLGLTTNSYYEKKRAEFAEQLAALPKPSGGPPPPALALARSGRSFAQTVVRSYTEGRITSADVSDFLNLKLRHLPDVMKSLKVGVSA